MFIMESESRGVNTQNKMDRCIYLNVSDKMMWRSLIILSEINTIAQILGNVTYLRVQRQYALELHHLTPFFTHR